MALVVMTRKPFLAAYRYKGKGFDKRADWEHVWELQRAEDRIAERIGQDVTHPEVRRAVERGLGTIPVRPSTAPVTSRAPSTGATAASSTCPRSGSSPTPPPPATATAACCSAGPGGTGIEPADMVMLGTASEVGPRSSASMPLAGRGKLHVEPEDCVPRPLASQTASVAEELTAGWTIGERSKTEPAQPAEERYRSAAGQAGVTPTPTPARR